MNIKKIVSAVTAFALSATMFAGFSIQANAATVAIEEDFADETYNVTIGAPSAGGVVPTIKGGKLTVANGSASGDRTAYVNFAPVTGKAFDITFKMAMTKSGTSGRNNLFYILPIQTTARYPDITNALLTVSQDYNGAITVNGTSIGTFNGTELTYNVIVDTRGGSTVTTITNGETEVATVKGTTTGTAVSTFNMQFNKSYGAFTLDDIVVKTLTVPTFTLSSKEATVDSTTTKTATVNVTDIVGTVSVESDNTSIATAEYADGVVTIKYVADGVANVTVTATNDGLTKEETIAVTSGTVDTTNVTINYVSNDTNKTTLLKSDTVSDVNVGSTLDLSSYIAKVTSYTDTKTGVTYTATYAGGVTEVEVTEDMSYALAYDLTENKLTTTLTSSMPNTKLSVTGTSTTKQTVSESVVTDYAGNATVDLYAGTYTITGTKSGYTATPSTVTAGASGNVVMTIDDAKNLYIENFDNGNVNILNTSSKRYKDSKFQMYGNTDLTSIITLSDTADKYLITIPGVAFTSNAITDTRSATLAIMDNATEIVNITTAFTGETVDGKNTTKVSKLSINGTDVENLVSGGDLIVYLDTSAAENNLVVKYAGETYTYTSAATSITGLRFATANNLYIALSSISIVKAPVITATTTKPVDITTAPTTTTADLINRETGAVQTAGAAVDLADVTTVYIKVDNVANKTVMPSIKVGTETYAPTYKYEINSNGYFVYQFVGVDLTGATVSYDGAADVTL